MTRSMRRRGVLITASLESMVLAGRATADVEGEPVLTIEDAKSGTRDMERQLLAQLPGVSTDSIEQADTGVLMNCPGDRQALWAGSASVAIDSAADPAQLFNALADRYSDDKRFEIDRRPCAAGEASLRLNGAGGESCLLGQLPNESRIEVLSFSACFVLADGQRAGTIYSGQRPTSAAPSASARKAAGRLQPLHHP